MPTSVVRKLSWSRIPICLSSSGWRTGQTLRTLTLSSSCSIHSHPNISRLYSLCSLYSFINNLRTNKPFPISAPVRLSGTRARWSPIPTRYIEVFLLWKIKVASVRIRFAGNIFWLANLFWNKTLDTCFPLNTHFLSPVSVYTYTSQSYKSTIMLLCE